MGEMAKTCDRGRVAGAPVSAWRRLHAVADRIRALDPWSWMTLGDVFGVRPRGAGETGFVLFSRQGSQQWRAVTVVPGWDAFHNALMNPRQQEAHRAPLEQTVEESWVRLMFLPADALARGDCAVLARLGVDLNAGDEYASFCSQKTGYFPDRPGPDEVVWMAAVLYQAYGMAMRIESNPGLTRERLPRSFFVRTQDAAGDWHDAWHDMPPPKIDVVVGVEIDRVERLRKRVRDATVLQVDLFLSPLKVKSPADHRSEAVFTLLVVNRETRMALSCEALQATNGVDTMWAQVPEAVLKAMERLDALPGEIEVCCERMLNVLRPLTEMLPFKLTRREKLDALSAARDSLSGLLRLRK